MSALSKKRHCGHFFEEFGHFQKSGTRLSKNKKFPERVKDEISPSLKKKMFLDEIFDLEKNNDNRENLKNRDFFVHKRSFSEACFLTFAAELRLILLPLVIGQVGITAPMPIDAPGP